MEGVSESKATGVRIRCQFKFPYLRIFYTEIKR